MMKNGGWRRSAIQEPWCLVESVIEIMPVSQISLGKDKEISNVFSVLLIGRGKPKMCLAAS